MTPERKGKAPRQEQTQTPLRFEKAEPEPLQPQATAKGTWRKTAGRLAQVKAAAPEKAAGSLEHGERPQAVTQPEGPPMESAADTPPAPQAPALAKSHMKRAAQAAVAVGGVSVRAKPRPATSGQIVPKSGSQAGAPAAPADKLHDRVSVLRDGPTDKLHHKAEAPAPGESTPQGVPQWKRRARAKAAPESPAQEVKGQEAPPHGEAAQGGRPAPAAEDKGVKASKLRMERREGKLEKAQGKLDRQKPVKAPSPVKRSAAFAGRTVHSYVHAKIYESEHENVGVEAAHRSELVGEVIGRKALHSAKRRIRNHPAKAVHRAELRYEKAKGAYHFQQAKLEHQELDKKGLAKLWQKRQRRKRYQKQAREAAKKSAQAAKGTVTVTEELGRAVVGLVRRHPLGVVVVLLCFLLLIVLQSCTTSLVAVGNGVSGGVAASTYPAQDADLTGAEAAYVGLEADLQARLDNYEATHSYDEYHYDLDEIEHDPYVLLSILSALHDGEWTLADVEGDLQTLFDRQYTLTESVRRETRYTTELQTDAEGNTHRVRVPYSYYICTVTLENANLSHLPVYMMGEDQLSRYALYMASLGNRPDLFPSSDYVDKYITNPPAPHEVPEGYLADPTFATMFTEAEKYLGYPYVWGGSSPATSFDCSGFISWVANQSGWDIGRLGATGLYNICTPTRSPRPGDIVFFTGTFDAPGVTHCGLYVGDGWMLHCGDPIQYANLNTSYWQAHFYAYGRLP